MKSLAAILCPILVLAGPGGSVGQETAAATVDSAQRTLQAMLLDVGPIRRNFADEPAEDSEIRKIEDENFALLSGEKRAAKWLAALVSDDPARRWEILERFPNTPAMKRFLHERDTIVDVWLYSDAPEGGRRLTARESAEWTRSANQAPTFLTVTFRESPNGPVVRARLEFGSGAAEESLASALAYQRHRHLQQEIRRVLRARDDAGNTNALAQWEAIATARRKGTLPLREMPAPPTNPHDLFHAFECRTSPDGQIAEVLRSFKASEIRPRLIDGVSRIELVPAGGGAPLTAVVYNPPSTRTALEGTGDDDTLPIAHGAEVRIRNPALADPRLWHRLEFGEPSLLRQQGLANFGLVNAHLESARKGLALKKAKLDRVAEPLFAGLNIGGGLAGVGVPLGESARLGYNVLLGRKYVPDVPTADELRGLYALYLAKARHPELHGEIPAKLSRSDRRELESAASRIPARDVDDALRSIDDRDLEAMLQLPQGQNSDQKYRLFADILTDLAKVTGETKSGLIRDLFDNQRLAPNGDLSLSTLLALAFGDDTLTPLSGYSLKDLARGEGPARAWLQYFNVSLDLRAIANTAYLLRKKGDVDRELQKPFLHAPRLSDLASYEIRVFGYPLLLRYKRGLLEDDVDAYRTAYAYGVLGTRVIARFPTQDDFHRELRAGTMAPIGYVRIPEKRGLFRKRVVESNLPVFGFRIPEGPHAGQTAIIIYGLKAHCDYSEFMEREALRFAQFESMLENGGVLERVLAAEDRDAVPRLAFEPALAVGESVVTARFSNLLSDLTEYHRYVKFDEWGLPRAPGETEAARALETSLRARQVDTSPGPSPLVEVDDYFGSFVYRKRIDGQWLLVQTVHFPSSADIRRDIAKRTAAARAERDKRRSPNGAAQASPGQRPGSK